MGVRRIVPNITTSCLPESRAFYTDLLGLTEAMDLGWIVTLVAPEKPAVQLSLLGPDETASVQAQISIEVDDVDRVYTDAVERGVPIVYPLTDEPWGVRRFFMTDPNGTVVNILSHLSRE
jgi:catechol 2,3-dioxygenase-like lactoylglutathione lyase family enzyme